MGSAKYHNAYKQNAVSTSSQGRLVLMMYEGAIKFVNMAMHGIDTSNISAKGLYIGKTRDIINELSLALDMEKGGEIAKRLESLYQFILDQLTHANIKSDRKSLESVQKVLLPLHDAWEKLLLPKDDKGEKPTNKTKFATRS